MRVMVTGGTGYIGAHTCLLLAKRGDYVLIADDVVTGSRDRVPGIPLLQLDLASEESRGVLSAAFREHEIDAVIHFAARKQVGESVEKPAWYFQQNIGGLAQVLMAMEDAAVSRFVFSSSAAVYGQADGAIDETADTRPLSPYGASKLVGEQLVAMSARAWGLRGASLRYFNVAGAARPELGDVEVLNLVPIVLDHLAAGEPPVIFGDDYDTPDGTCIRDYVHVTDVAEAHLAVLDWLPSTPGHVTLNIGTGIGTSVRDIIARITAISGSDLKPVVHGRRLGDAGTVVAIVDRVRELTGWEARLGLDEIVRSAWESRVYFDLNRAGSGG
jgi:UDP-glucose 4-epimerase